MSKARQGLDRLLELRSDAEVVNIEHQAELHILRKRIEDFTRKTDGPIILATPSGPWTTVTLKESDQFVHYAIWNETGNVYRVEVATRLGEILLPGPVEDDPFIVVTA